MERSIKSALMDFCETAEYNVFGDVVFTWTQLHAILVIESLKRQGRYEDIESFKCNPRKWRGYMNCPLSNYFGQGYCLRPSKFESRYLKKLDNGYYKLIKPNSENENKYQPSLKFNEIHKLYSKYKKY